MKFKNIDDFNRFGNIKSQMAYRKTPKYSGISKRKTAKTRCKLLKNSEIINNLSKKFSNYKLIFNNLWEGVDVQYLDYNLGEGMYTYNSGVGIMITNISFKQSIAFKPELFEDIPHTYNFTENPVYPIETVFNDTTFDEKNGPKEKLQSELLLSICPNNTSFVIKTRENIQIYKTDFGQGKESVYSMKFVML